MNAEQKRQRAMINAAEESAATAQTKESERGKYKKHKKHKGTRKPRHKK